MSSNESQLGLSNFEQGKHKVLARLFKKRRKANCSGWGSSLSRALALSLLPAEHARRSLSLPRVAHFLAIAGHLTHRGSLIAPPPFGPRVSTCIEAAPAVLPWYQAA